MLKKIFLILGITITNLLLHASSQELNDAQRIINITPLNSAIGGGSTYSLDPKDEGRDIIAQNYIDLSQILSSKHHDRIYRISVQLVENDEPILFNRQHGLNENGGYFWYGENGARESSLSIQIHGNKCLG